METKDNENNLDWIFELKEKIPDFLSNLKGKKRKSFIIILYQEIILEKDLNGV